MNVIDLALSCKDALRRGSIDMPLVMKGRWGKRNYRYFAGKGSPKGEIVREMEHGIVVMFPVRELLDYTIGQLSSICHEIGCSGMDPATCPGNPNCGILRMLFKHSG